MATRVRTSAAKTTASKAKTTTAKPKTAVEKTTTKRAVARVDNSALAEQVGALRAEGKSHKDIAAELNIGLGKTMFLEMVDTVSNTPKLKLAGRTDEDIAAKVVAARLKQDEHSSWGWLAARSGKSEAFCRKAYEDAGHTVKGEHVASARKAAKAPAASTKKAPAKRGTRAKASSPSS